MTVAPTVARVTVLARREALWQALYAKEPVHVQLAKIQAALSRVEATSEKKRNLAWSARDEADKADEHVANLRQRVAELVERVHADAQGDSHWTHTDQDHCSKLCEVSWWRVVLPRSPCNCLCLM